MRVAGKGLARAKELYEERGQRAKELRVEGRKVLGYVCLFAPPEIMHAAGVLPYRLRGDPREPITSAHTYVEPLGCPYVRNLFDQDLKGRNAFLDGIVMSHSCDMVQRVYGIWTYNNKPPFQYFVNVPHTLVPWSREFYKRELGFFREKMEQFAGNQVAEIKLKESIRLYNRSRALIRELYELRKLDPPLISGTEVLEVLVAGMGIPVEEFIDLLGEVIEEVKARDGGPERRAARLLVYGSVCDDTTFVRLVEGSGANVVTDDTCIGTRSFRHDVPETADPLDGLVDTYFDDFMCPRTDRGTDIDRFQYILDLAREYNANGVIMYIYAFCDPHKFDAPDVRRYLEQAGLPVLIIDDDYTMTNLAAIRTRVQAFAEMLR
ncbi:MAG TPA: 2-hydroxyacyl-CoA dehydratase [Dehalococcoidia bacterium]|nr:2-hydroxyacyl-CoA dehydratase [Dehalococcoidia bacterium]